MNQLHLAGMCVLTTALIHGSASNLLAQAPVQELLDSAAQAAEKGDHAAAIKLASAALQKDASVAIAYYLRGRERFRAGQIELSLEDFDKYVELQPQSAPKQWERGIACYYAGQFEKGAKQFESYQQYDGHDVENSVWRYLCLARQIGVQQAQDTMLPIEKDSRVPMMQIYELYRGKLNPDEVLAAVRTGNPSAEVLAARMFYADLYLGLWHEVQGDRQQAKRHIDAAADEKLKDNPRLNRYMWDVARNHQRLMNEVRKKRGEKK